MPDTRLSDQDLRDLIRLSDAATAGPWGHEVTGNGYEIAPFDDRGRLDWDNEVAATVDENKDNADLIVESRNAIRPLAEELLATRAALAEIENVVLVTKGHGPASPVTLIQVPDLILEIINKARGPIIDHSAKGK